MARGTPPPRSGTAPGLKGGSGVEETVHLFQAEESRESVFGLCAHEVEGLPVARKDVVVEESDGAGADAHGAWRESVNILAVEDVLLQFLFRDEVRRCAIELSQQAYRTDRGLLGTFALATELERSNHLLTQRGHTMPPFFGCTMCLSGEGKDIVEGRERQKEKREG